MLHKMAPHSPKKGKEKHELVLLIVTHLSMISSSIVVDSLGQKSVYLTDYCPNMKFCPEGAHVMCMYYNAKSKMGPQCSNAQNISMTQDLATKLLDVSNAVRSRIAQGKEKGKHGTLLPRGYGIFRLNWDTELATFAQVLANQCVLRHDLCRATKRFPDPGQTAGLVRFSYPDWFPVSKSGNFTTAGLSPAKLLYATTQILKSWYGQKNSVTPNMITFYPDWSLNPNSQDGRLYLEMIYGSATHMGCGISAYTEYAFYDNNAALNYNSVQIICNYSARPRQGTAVYNTVPPGDTAEPFSRCGCPVGSEGDEECLCQELRKPLAAPMQLKAESRHCPEGQNCDPTVVVLPIFTMEDAPPEKLYNHDSFANISLRRPMHLNEMYHSEIFDNKRNLYAADKMRKPQAHGSKDKTSQRQSYTQNIRHTSHNQAVAIRNRYFDKKHMKHQQSHAAHNARKKESLFSRAAKFELPQALMRPTKEVGIKDVMPRKDFTNVKQLVKKYLFGSNDSMKPQYNKPIEENKGFGKHEVSNHDNEHTHVEHETNELAMHNQERKNLGHPLYSNVVHEVKTSINEQEQPKTETYIEHTPEHEMTNTMESKHHLAEVFNILNATKPKITNEYVKYQNILRTTESVLNKAEQNIMIQDAFLKQIVSNRKDYNNPLNSVTEEGDNKLMALLDTLEQEVKHVELRDKDKQLFDAKIRKIYGKVVGKSASLLDLSANKYTTIREKPLPDSRNSFVMMKKSVQQEPKEEPLYEKYNMKTEGPDETGRQSETNHQKKYGNSTRDMDEIDKFDERNLYTKRYGLREINNHDMLNEPVQNRRHNYESDHEYGERKIYRNNDFDRNTLSDLDEPRHRGVEIKNRSRNTERDHHYRDDEPEHRNGNEVEHRRRNENYRRYGAGEQSVRNKNYYLNNDAGGDDLSVERRRFYQEKLDNIERKLQMRNYKKRKDKPRHMRPMRPTVRKSESQMDIFGRGRLAHGY